MELIVQPADGTKPILGAIEKAETTLDIVIFRFDVKSLEKAIEAAVKRGVAVRALIAHTNSGGEKRLRQLELRMLDAGVTVSRTADDLARYHGKLMIVDFGQCEALPRLFRSLLWWWLAKFHVTPRARLHSVLAVLARRDGASLEFTPLYGGYAWYAVLTRPSAAARPEPDGRGTSPRSAPR